MGQSDSTPATVEDIIDLQEKLHKFHDTVSEEVGSGTETTKKCKQNLQRSLTALDDGIRGVKQVMVEAREATDSESKILDSFASIRNAVDTTIDSISKIKGGDPDDSLTGVLSLSVVMSGAFAGAPCGLVAAFCNITVAFMEAFTADQTESFGYIVHEDSVIQRTREDDSKLADLRAKVKHFIDDEVPRYGEPEKATFPLNLDLFTELQLASGLMKSRFMRATSNRQWDRDDAPKAVSTYCLINTIHIHMLTVLLLKFRALEREADAVCIVDRLELLKNKVYEDLGFWVRFWQDFQNDQAREEFFALVPGFSSTSPVVLETKKLQNSVLCKTTKGVMVVEDGAEACCVYNSDYDFKPIQARVHDIHMLECLYKLSKTTEGEDPAHVRLFCQALFNTNAISCADLPTLDKNVFRTILRQAGIPPKTSWWCAIL